MPRVRQTPKEAEAARQETPAERQANGLAMLRHYRECFGGVSGQIVLADLLKRCRILGERGTERMEGQADVGRHIIDMITRDPNSLLRFQLTSDTGDLLNERDAGPG